MEENKEVGTTNEDVEVANETSKDTQEEMISKKEVNKIVEERLKRAKKDLPTDEELKGYREWQESKKSQEDKYNDLVKKDGEKTKTISNLKMENAVLKAGIHDEDEIEFIIFKVSKMEGDFNDNLTEYLKDNPRFSKKQETKATGVENKQQMVQQDDGVTAILKAKHPDLFE